MYTQKIKHMVRALFWFLFSFGTDQFYACRSGLHHCRSSSNTTVPPVSVKPICRILVNESHEFSQTDDIIKNKAQYIWMHIVWDILYIACFRADSRFVLSQWETSLPSNAISHWLGAMCLTSNAPSWLPEIHYWCNSRYSWTVYHQPHDRWNNRSREAFRCSHKEE